MPERKPATTGTSSASSARSSSASSAIFCERELVSPTRREVATTSARRVTAAPRAALLLLHHREPGERRLRAIVLRVDRDRAKDVLAVLQVRTSRLTAVVQLLLVEPALEVDRRRHVAGISRAQRQYDAGRRLRALTGDRRLRRGRQVERQDPPDQVPVLPLHRQRAVDV